MNRILITGLAALALAAPATAATTGGGSVVSAGQTGSQSFTVAGIGTLTKVGPRASAALTVALYQVPPGGGNGRLVAYKAMGVPGRTPVATLIVRSTCIRTPKPRVWFTVATARSRAKANGPAVTIRSVGRSYRLFCR